MQLDAYTEMYTLKLQGDRDLYHEVWLGYCISWGLVPENITTGIFAFKHSSSKRMNVLKGFKEELHFSTYYII